MPRNPDPTGPAAGVIGLIPAAGRARRLGRLPASKEVLPLGFVAGDGGARPRLACHGLLAAFAAAGIDRALIALGDGKWDVPAALGAGEGTGVALAYLPVAGSRSVPETLDRARPFVSDREVALGFPDVWFEPVDAFARVLARRRGTGAEVALGCFPAAEPRRTDLVDLGADGAVRGIAVRPATAGSGLNWLIAAWTPRFTAFLGGEVAAARPDAGRGTELQLGEVFARALDAGLAVTAVAFPQGRYRDLGTPEDLAAVWRAGGDPLASE